MSRWQDPVFDSLGIGQVRPMASIVRRRVGDTVVGLELGERPDGFVMTAVGQQAIDLGKDRRRRSRFVPQHSTSWRYVKHHRTTHRFLWSFPDHPGRAILTTPE